MHKKKKIGHAPICVFVTSEEDSEDLIELARSRQISSTVLSSTAEIQFDIPLPFFRGMDRQLAVELDFATHLFIILDIGCGMNKGDTE